MNTDDLETNPTLLERLRVKPEARDWQVFYDRYAVVVLSFACKHGLSLDAAHDVLQETMVTLMRVLPTFTYDREKGRFHNFVYTIARNRIRAEKRLQRYDREVSMDQPHDEDALALGERIEDKSVVPPAEEIDRRWQHSLWEKALNQLMNSTKYKDQVKAVFRDYVLENQKPEVVAAKHGESKNNVYQIKNRMLKDLAEEIRRLSKSSEEGLEPA